MEKLYYNGKIITMEENGDSIHPEAVLVRNGLITYVGTLEAAKRAARSKVTMVNLQGRCLMPAFIDPHSHIVMNGQMSICADLSDCESHQDIICTLKDYIAKHKVKKGQLVMGFGYDHNFLQEGTQPDKRVLDQVSTEHPIMIMHVSAHLCCVNSAMLALSALPLNEPNPQGGFYGRMPDGKELSGYAEETAMVPFQQLLKKIMKPDIMGMLRNMQKTYLEHGVTTAQEGAANLSNLRMLQLMGLLNMLKMDVVVYPVMGEDGSSIMRKYGGSYRNYKKHVKIGGYKVILDGSPQGRTAWMTKPYLGGEEGYCAYPWMKDEVLEQYMLQALQEKRQVLAHCNGDAAGDQYLRAYEKALKQTACSEELRPVMIHCQTARNDQLDKMAELKMIASIFVGHVWYWGDVHWKNFGEERGNHISPAKDAMDRGLSVNFHQDTPITKPNMLHSVWCAVNRISRSGRVIGEDQKISVYDALKAVTINAAYEYFEEDSKGSIKAGKRADLVILDQSPLHIDPKKIREIKVIETIKDGKTVYHA